MKTMKYLLVMLCVLSAVSGFGQTVRYVKTNGTTTAENAANATSWATACADLQAVINASDEGDEIWVAAGTYKPNRPANSLNTIDETNRNNAFVLKKDVKVYGSFVGTETTLEERQLPEAGDYNYITILSGDFLDNDDATLASKSENAYHIVISVGDAGTARFDGFTITGGNSNGTSYVLVNSQQIHQYFGGGMYNNNSSLAYANINVYKNEAKNVGGGIYNCSSSNSNFLNVNISGNGANIQGGGMANVESSPTLADVNIVENGVVNNGGGIWNSASSPILTNVTISGNEAFSGGGIYNIDSSPVLTDVIICKNKTGAGSGDAGGGMYNNASSPKLTNVSIYENSTTAGYGGGIYNTNASSPILTNVVITENSSQRGGGICNVKKSSPILTAVKIHKNTATSGAGISNDDSSPILNDVSINENVAQTNGGGMYNINNSVSKLTDVIIDGNTACAAGGYSQGSGGGIYNNYSSLVLVNVIISRNGAKQYNGGGGGIYNYGDVPVLMTNVSITKNTSSNFGGGIYNDYFSEIVMTNVNISGNTANNGGGMYNVSHSHEIRNSIIWGNGVASKNVFNSNSSYSPTYSHSLVEGVTAEGVIFDGANPFFVDAKNGDLRLQAGSPCIYAGNKSFFDTGQTPDLSAITTDLAGNPRIVDGKISLGAYEWQGGAIPGCTDSEAMNYNPFATEDNGTCVHFVKGCTDKTATNYNELATKDDGSCEYKPVDIFGCMDETALNYNELATIDDKSCEYKPTDIFGCMDETALNYNELATIDDKSCEYKPVDIFGCMDETALNYNELATIDDESCEYKPADIFGCMDVTATNYNELATIDDESCEYKPADVFGCMDETALNYNEFATIDDKSCEYKPADIFGCMDVTATNYNELATIDDESCEYKPADIFGCMDETALNYNELATIDDKSCEYAPILGCTNPEATNYNPLANQDDKSCIYPIKGCTDNTAENYNSLATKDDASCKYSVTVSVAASAGGTVSGGGVFTVNSTATVKAVAASGYKFVEWLENGTQVSTEANYTFAVGGVRNLTCVFERISVQIEVTSIPAGAGALFGGGNYFAGDKVQLSAFANSGYTFINWIEDGEVVSIGGLHSFTASKNRNLIAVFSERKTDISGIEIPAGEGIIVVPDVQSARVVWNDLSEATGYKLLITDSSGTLICTLEFDANGRLITLVYTPDALKSDEVFGVRLINLTENTTYYYTMEIFGKNNAVIETKTGTFTTKGGGVGIAETLQATSLQVYPNPTTGQLTISGGVETHGRASLPQTVEIYDNTGRFVGVEYFRPTQNNGLTIDISHLPNGVYFVAVNGKRVKVVKN